MHAHVSCTERARQLDRQHERTDDRDHVRDDQHAAEDGVAAHARRGTANLGYAGRQRAPAAEKAARSWDRARPADSCLGTPCLDTHRPYRLLARHRDPILVQPNRTIVEIR